MDENLFCCMLGLFLGLTVVILMLIYDAPSWAVIGLGVQTLLIAVVAYKAMLYPKNNECNKFYELSHNRIKTRYAKRYVKEPMETI